MLIERIVAASTDAGDVVWDPFCGTGSIALAAARMGRPAYTAETNPCFIDLAQRRIAAMERTAATLPAQPSGGQ